VKAPAAFPANLNAIMNGRRDRIFILGCVPALALYGPLASTAVKPVDILCGAATSFVAEASGNLFGRWRPNPTWLARPRRSGLSPTTSAYCRAGRLAPCWVSRA